MYGVTFKKLDSTSHSAIWKFINALQKEEQLNRMKIEQYIAGIQPPSQKISKDRSAKIKIFV
jgi:hypothetical protein